MKALNVIKKIVIGILAVVFFGFVIFMTILVLNYNKYGVTEIDNKSLVIIPDKIASDKYDKGDLVLIKKLELEELKIGDEIFAYKVASTGEVGIDLGIIEKIHVDEKAVTFENGSTYAVDFVIGETDQKISKIGTYLSIVSSRWGFLFLILVPTFLIFIYQLYALIVEIKYNK